MIIGVTGNIGSGKSTISKLLANALDDTVLIDADSVAHQIINNNLINIEQHIGVTKQNWINDKKLYRF